ncbi:MAG: OadG family protein [Bacteroidales bacterium]|nr:OadG family protein [Bacteroidales bacterium]
MDCQNLPEALRLMVVGMTTVFSVLLIIIGFGKTLIWAVNKYLPEEEQPKQQARPAAQAAVVSTDVAQAIAKAVEQLTGGKGKVEKIEKI